MLTFGLFLVGVSHIMYRVSLASDGRDKLRLYRELIRTVGWILVAVGAVIMRLSNA